MKFVHVPYVSNKFLSTYCVPNRMEEIIQSIKYEESSSNQPSGVKYAQTTQLLAGMTVAKSKIENLRLFMTGTQFEERRKASEQAEKELMGCPDFERLFKK